MRIGCRAELCMVWREDIYTARMGAEVVQLVNESLTASVMTPWQCDTSKAQWLPQFADGFFW